MKSKKEIKENEIKEQDVKETPVVQPSGKKGVKIAKTVLNVFVNVLIVLVLIVSVVIATLALTSKANGGVPQVFGRSFHTIMSPSMEGGSEEFDGGDYKVGDLVVGKTTGRDPEAVYEIGDIVVYLTKNNEMPDGVEMVCHRIIARDNVNGRFLYTTKGDNNDAADSEPHSAGDIVAVCYDKDYNAKVIRGFGNVMNFIRSPKGFFIVILVPMIIFFLYAILRVVINSMNYKKAKAEEAAEDAEVQKQAEIDAAVKAALAAAGVDKNSPESENSAEENKE